MDVSSLHPNPSKNFKQRLHALDAASDFLPCVIIIHNLQTLAVEYMSQRGLRALDVTIEELHALGAEYHHRFFNPEDAADYVPKILGLVERRNPNEILTFFQQVRTREGAPFEWYVSSLCVFAVNKEGTPTHTITTAFPIDNMHHLTTQAARLLSENNFLRSNIGRLHSLSSREKEVLSLLAKGRANKEVAAALGISSETVSTHRRNVKRKLGAATLADLARYAHALELL